MRKQIEMKKNDKERTTKKLGKMSRFCNFLLHKPRIPTHSHFIKTSSVQMPSPLLDGFVSAVTAGL